MPINIPQAQFTPQRKGRLCFWGLRAGCDLKQIAADALQLPLENITKVIRYGWRGKHVQLPNGEWRKIKLQRLQLTFADGSRHVYEAMPDLFLPHFSVLTTDAWTALCCSSARKTAAVFEQTCANLSLKSETAAVLPVSPGRLERLAAVKDLIKSKISSLISMSEEAAAEGAVWVLDLRPCIAAPLPFWGIKA